MAMGMIKIFIEGKFFGFQRLYRVQLGSGKTEPKKSS